MFLGFRWVRVSWFLVVFGGFVFLGFWWFWWVRASWFLVGTYGFVFFGFGFVFLGFLVEMHGNAKKCKEMLGNALKCKCAHGRQFFIHLTAKKQNGADFPIASHR